MLNAKKNKKKTNKQIDTLEWKATTCFFYEHFYIFGRMRHGKNVIDYTQDTIMWFSRLIQTVL